MALAHSYSAVKDFENCPRKYQQVRILKRFKQEDTAATLYGTEVHSALENYIKNGTPLPAHFAHYHQFVEPISNLKGTIQCELKMAIREDFSPCGFFDKDVWYRGIPDVLAINGGTARVVDWKTGKSSKYADTKQLELLAGMVMSHYPEVHTVKGVLVFLVPGDVVKADFTRGSYSTIMSNWWRRASAIEDALENDVWNARPSGLCGFCPVTHEACPHSRK